MAPAGHSERAAGGGEVAASSSSRVDRGRDLQVISPVVLCRCAVCAIDHGLPVFRSVRWTAPSGAAMWTTVAPAQLGGSIWVGADFCLATQK